MKLILTKRMDTMIQCVNFLDKKIEKCEFTLYISLFRLRKKAYYVSLIISQEVKIHNGKTKKTIMCKASIT